jgi:hypothetical protein
MVRFLAVTIIATAFPFVCAAGPMLDTLVSAMGNVRTITREQETMVGVSEVYTDLRISYESASAITNIKKATISRAGSNYVVFLEGVDATTKNGPVSAGSVEVQIDPAALSHNALFTDLMEGRPASPSDCARIKDDIFFAVRHLVSVDMQADAMDLKFGFEESRVECLLDFTVSMEGAVAGDGMKVGLMKVAGVGPLTMSLPEIRTGEEFAVKIDLQDANNPSDQGRFALDEMSLNAYIDVDSATGLARAGLNDIFRGSDSEFSTTDGHARMNDFWNAAIKLDGSVDVSVKGMTMAPEAQPYLKAGAKQDVRLFLQKSEQSIVFQSGYSTPDLLDLDVSADIVMNKATRERGFAPMLGLFGIPISLSGVSASISDRGAIGMMTAQFGNVSFGDVLNLMMADSLGSQNVEAINAWIAGAQDGGTASVKATPRKPLRLDELSRIIQADPGQLLDMVDIEPGLPGQ